MIAVLLVATIGTVTFLVAAELLAYALLAVATLELVNATQFAAVGLILAARALGGAIATRCHIQAQLQIARALIHGRSQSATADVDCSTAAAAIAVELVGQIAAIVVAITDQFRIEALAQQTAMHIGRTRPMSTLVVLIGGIAAIDSPVAFPAASNARAAAALEHACITAG